MADAAHPQLAVEADRLPPSALAPHNALDQLLEPSFYPSDDEVATGAQAAAIIPSGVTVEEVNNVGPALTRRATVLLWEPRSHNAPWVVANVKRQTYPFASVDAQRKKVTALDKAGYGVVFQRDGYVVLHRP